MLPNDVRQAITELADEIWLAKVGDVRDEECGAIVRAWLDAPPQAPQPDWSQAPDLERNVLNLRCHWWTVDADGLIRWHAEEPVQGKREWKSLYSMYTYVEGNPLYIDIPLGIDWRTLKVKRPEAHNG